MPGRYSIIFNAESCVACSACAVVCADQNDIEVKDLSDMFHKVATGGEHASVEGILFSWRSISCLHCDPAPCMEACPVGACTYMDDETEFTVYDNSGCIACRLCGEVCPFDALQLKDIASGL